MKSLIVSILATFSIAIASSQAQAQEQVNEPAMMVYYSIPFGAKSRNQSMSTYGFRMDTLESEGGVTFSSFNGQPAMMDFAVNEDGPQALSFNGVNAMKKVTVYNADSGETQTETLIDLGLIAVGIIGVIAIANNDDNECSIHFNINGDIFAAADPCVGFSK